MIDVLVGGDSGTIFGTFLGVGRGYKNHTI